jgi:hypothetical protein
LRAERFFGDEAALPFLGRKTRFILRPLGGGDLARKNPGEAIFGEKDAVAHFGR